jgi:hypothetical protein
MSRLGFATLLLLNLAVLAAAPSPPAQGTQDQPSATQPLATQPQALQPQAPQPQAPQPLTTQPSMTQTPAGKIAPSEALPSQAAPGIAPAEIRDIRNPLPEGGPPPFTLTLIGILLTGGATAAWFRVRRAGMAPPAPVGADCRTPDCIPDVDPCQALELLAESYRRGEVPTELFCLRIAALVRADLAARSGLPASRLTSGELLEHLRGPGLLTAGELSLADRVLSLCDWVKFAGHDAGVQEAKQLLATARELLAGQRGGRHEVS